MNSGMFAVFCVLALAASAQAISQSDVDSFLETTELAQLENGRNLLQDAMGTPGMYGYGSTRGAVEAAAATSAATACTQGKATAYTATATKMCVIPTIKSTKGTIYNGVGGKISSSTGVTCYVTACPAGTTTAAAAAAAAAITTPATTTSTTTSSSSMFSLSNLFGKGRRLASASNRKLLGTNLFFPFFHTPFLSGSSSAASSSTAATTTAAAAASSSYYSAQCFTVCE